uniref:Uncharacterized protein n=1 Tax=Panagrolaimus sp. ES5 TaxID=591445 RepID=A0AC34G2A1_9BILA
MASSQSPSKIKEEYDENSFNNMEAKPSTAKDLSSDLDEDFPISEPNEAKTHSSAVSVNLRRHFIASPKDSKNLVEIKRDHNVHLPLLLRKNWRKKPNPPPATTTKKVSSKMSARNAVHCSTSVSGGPPPKIRRNA